MKAYKKKKKKTLENLLVSKLSPCLSTIPREQLPPKSQLFNFYIKPQNGYARLKNFKI